MEMVLNQSTAAVEVAGHAPGCKCGGGYCMLQPTWRCEFCRGTFTLTYAQAAACERRHQAKLDSAMLDQGDAAGPPLSRAARILSDELWAMIFRFVGHVSIKSLLLSIPITCMKFRRVCRRHIAVASLNFDTWRIRPTSVGLTVESLQAMLGRVNSVHSLKVSDWRGLRSIPAGNQLRTLKSLDLSGCPLVPGALQQLGRLVMLESLDLSKCGEGVTDGGLACLASLQKLEVLVLKHCLAVTDTGLASVTALRSLKTLVVGADESRATEWLLGGSLLCYDRQPFITDSGLALLAELPQLDTLIMSHCGLITDAGLQSLARFPRLKELQLNGSSIRGIGFPRVNLVAINLMDCPNLNDEGLFNLGEKCPKLTNLYLFRSWGFSKAAYKSFSATFVHCKAHIEGREHMWGWDDGIDVRS
mmetsp:Transcript_4478/g.11411  ORF Transcript_4478/g.11411 Transcript_4478/m.11411 type:complete len:417 (-) Transcript_4478:123-1373(-)